MHVRRLAELEAAAEKLQSALLAEMASEEAACKKPKKKKKQKRKKGGEAGEVAAEQPLSGEYSIWKHIACCCHPLDCLPKEIGAPLHALR